MRSEAFSVDSGFPQGNLLGGKFFNLLMDRVLNKLQEKGLGCHVDTIFAEADVYVDDLILLSPSLIGMQLMLHFCSNEFNVSKCVAVVISKTIGSNVKNLVLCDNVIPRRRTYVI